MHGLRQHARLQRHDPHPRRAVSGRRLRLPRGLPAGPGPGVREAGGHPDPALRLPHASLPQGRLWRRIYSRYPAFCRRLEQEEKIFNRQYEELERLQREGKAFLLCPTGRAKVGRLERDPQRLEALYLEGRKAMLDALPALREFLAK